MSTLDEYLKKVEKETAPNTEKKVAAVNNAAATSSQIVKDDYNAQMAEAEQSYNELFDQNSVQRIINERTIAENMANAGLTDSGLNRTQMTANQLSYANNQSKISRQQQSAVETLARAMNSKLAEIETNRATQEAGIRTSAYDNNYAQAVSMYNAEQKAISDSITAAQKQQQDDYNKVMAALGNKNYTDEFKQQHINNFKNKYGYTDPQVQQMFGSPGTKYTYADGELENGTTAAWDDKLLQDTISKYYSAIPNGNSRNEGYLATLVDELAQQYGWGFNTEQAFYNTILERVDNSILGFSANPNLFTYTVLDPKKEYDYTGDIANKVQVVDQYGVVRTIEDVYYMTKVKHAKSEAAKFGGDWTTYLETPAVIKAAKNEIKTLQTKLGITK